MPGLRLFAFGAISEKGWGLGSEIELGNHIVGGLLVYLNPAPLGIRHQQTAIRCIEFHGRGLGEGPAPGQNNVPGHKGCRERRRTGRRNDGAVSSEDPEPRMWDRCPVSLEEIRWYRGRDELHF